MDALLQTALVSPSRYGRDAATRALAWVPNLADRGAHLMRLERDPDPLRAKVGSKALLEARNHTLFSREGEFASAFEHTLYDALKAFLQRGDADASQLLARALSAGALRLAVDGDPSQLGATAALVTYEGMQLVDHDVLESSKQRRERVAVAHQQAFKRLRCN